MSTAFDPLHPPLMLRKLRAYGFEENTLNLLRFYRTDRRNRVKLGPVKSNWHTVNRGCPQGSAVGPLPWNILENDLTDEIKSDVSMHADDHQLYKMGEDLAKVKSSIAGNAEKASRWYEVNLLKGNFSKYKTMLMHNDDKVTTSLSLNIQGNEIELTDKLPLLRVSIDCNLKFSDHIKMAAYLNEIGNPSNPCYVSDIRQYRDACVLPFFNGAA